MHFVSQITLPPSEASRVPRGGFFKSLLGLPYLSIFTKALRLLYSSLISFGYSFEHSALAYNWWASRAVHQTTAGGRPDPGFSHIFLPVI
jgi:hypothetical protein